MSLTLEGSIPRSVQSQGRQGITARWKYGNRGIWPLVLPVRYVTPKVTVDEARDLACKHFVEALPDYPLEECWDGPLDVAEWFARHGTKATNDDLRAFYLFRFIPTFEGSLSLHAPDPIGNDVEYRGVAIDRLDGTPWTRAEWHAFEKLTLQDYFFATEEMLDEAER